jgi:hypothetical protein
MPDEHSASTSATWLSAAAIVSKIAAKLSGSRQLAVAVLLAISSEKEIRVRAAHWQEVYRDSADEIYHCDSVLEGEILPEGLWRKLTSLPDALGRFKSMAGTFSGGLDFDGPIDAFGKPEPFCRIVELEGLEFAVEDFGDLFQQPAPANSNNGGRPAARWWESFAVELAVYVHENGAPDRGRGDQAEFTDAILERVSVSSNQHPGRETIRPVIVAVIERIREAGS